MRITLLAVLLLVYATPSSGQETRSPERQATQELFEAARRGLPRLIQPAVLAGADLNARDHEDYTPLSRALFQEHWDTALALVQAGADPNLGFEETCGSPLLLMVGDADINPAFIPDFKPNIKRIEVLLANGANPGAGNYMDSTVVHFAARAGNQQLLELLLQHGADPDTSGPLGRTPLHVAAQRNDLDALSALLAAGGDPIAIDDHGRTPIHLAAEEGSLATLRALCDLVGNIGPADFRGLSPLHLAAAFQQEEAALALLPYAENDGGKTQHGRKPQHWAAIANATACNFVPLIHGVEEDPRDVFGFSPGDYQSLLRSSPPIQPGSTPGELPDWDGTPPLLFLGKNNSHFLGHYGLSIGYWADGVVLFAPDLDEPSKSMIAGFVGADLVMALESLMMELEIVSLGELRLWKMHPRMGILSIRRERFEFGWRAPQRDLRDPRFVYTNERSIVRALRLSWAILESAAHQANQQALAGRRFRSYLLK